jgi:hypothetical protein
MARLSDVGMTQTFELPASVGPRTASRERPLDVAADDGWTSAEHTTNMRDMDSRDCLTHDPFVVVRIACRDAAPIVSLDWLRNLDLKSPFAT